MMRTVLNAGATLGRYALWLALSALGIIDILLMRTTMIDVMFRTRVSGWAIPAIEKWAFFVLALIWLAVVVWLEEYLTRAKTSALFWRRAARTTAAVGGVLVITLVLNVVL